MLEYIIYYIILCGMGYIIGSIPFSQWLNSDKELTHYGSTNIYRNSGFWKGLIVQTLDILKGMTVFFVLPQFQLMWLMSIMIGQILPCLWNKRGGKGVNTFFGGMFIINPLMTMFGFVIFLITYTETEIVAISSLISVLLITLSVGLINPLFVLLFILILMTHKPNLENILYQNKGLLK